jgi:heme oxygenase (biliverdin-producing, ferredoxin)
VSTILRDLTWENHKKAERCAFVGKLLKKKVSLEEYYEYLSNQLMCYFVLENIASELGLLKDMEEIKRSIYISKDLMDLEKENDFKIPIILPSTHRYIEHLRRISRDPDKIIAHIYVRHMGDLSGGQILKKLVPGKGLCYHFDTDVEVLKRKIRNRLSPDMADEANICFEMVINFFEELAEKYGE